MQHLFPANNRTTTATSNTTGGFSFPDLFKGVHLPSLGGPATSVACTAYSKQYHTDYAGEACQDALNAGIDPRIFVRQIYQESGFNPASSSSTGDRGIAQFQLATAAGMGVNPDDPHDALKGAARLMARHLAHYHGDMAKALASYNAGEGTVDSAVVRGGDNWQAYLPAITQNYIRIIMN